MTQEIMLIRKLDKFCCDLEATLPDDKLVEEWYDNDNLIVSYMNYLFRPSEAQENLMAYMIMEEMPLNSYLANSNSVTFDGAKDDMYEIIIAIYSEVFAYSDEKCEIKLEEMLK